MASPFSKSGEDRTNRAISIGKAKAKRKPGDTGPETRKRRRQTDHEPVRPTGHAFSTSVEVAEIDDRGRASVRWTARTTELGTSHLVVLSRRMCYEGRQILICIPLEDDEQFTLLGTVVQCGYHGEGLCQIDIDLVEVPDDSVIQEWMG